MRAVRKGYWLVFRSKYFSAIGETIVCFCCKGDRFTSLTDQFFALSKNLEWEQTKQALYSKVHSSEAFLFHKNKADSLLAYSDFWVGKPQGSTRQNLFNLADHVAYSSGNRHTWEEKLFTNGNKQELGYLFSATSSVELSLKIETNFASMLGVTYTTINCWENAHVQLSPPALKQIKLMLEEIICSPDMKQAEQEHRLLVHYFSEA